jgi:hypothetical protein
MPAEHPDCNQNGSNRVACDMISGKVLAYSEAVDAGVIRSHDDKCYYFTKTAWWSAGQNPRPDMLVTFLEENGKRACGIFAETDIFQNELIGSLAGRASTRDIHAHQMRLEQWNGQVSYLSDVLFWLTPGRPEGFK